MSVDSPGYPRTRSALYLLIMVGGIRSRTDMRGVETFDMVKRYPHELTHPPLEFYFYNFLLNYTLRRSLSSWESSWHAPSSPYTVCAVIELIFSDTPRFFQGRNRSKEGERWAKSLTQGQLCSSMFPN